MGIVLLFGQAGGAQAASYSLTVTAEHGSVVVSPHKPQYAAGEVVKLIPRPETGYSFSGWSGDVNSKRLVLTVTMDGHKNIAADFGAWMPPLGIPMPEFGIFETYRMYDDPGNRNPELAYRQNAEGGYYTHYTDKTNPNATDSDNPFGTIAKPRITIPSKDLPPGSVCEVHGGPYEWTWQWFSGLGTFEHPIFIRGSSRDDRAVLSRMAHTGSPFSVRIGGRYLIIENFEVNNGTYGTHNLYPEGVWEYIAVRDCEFYGFNGSSGSMITPGGRDRYPNDIILYNNHIHHNGNVPVGGSTDVHGIAVMDNSERVWIVDNYIHHNDGDAIQVNGCGGSCCLSGEWAKYVYIGRNVMHGDRENAVDLKDSEHVIVSQNEMFGYTVTPRAYGINPEVRPVHGSDGTAMLPGNEGGRMTWVIFNHIYDVQGAVRVDDECVVANAYIVGNVIYDVNAYGLITWRTMNIHAVNNTFHGVGIGFYSHHTASTGGSSYSIVNNILSEMTGHHDEYRGLRSDYVYMGLLGNGDRTVFRNNLLWDGGGFMWPQNHPYPTLVDLMVAGRTGALGCIEAAPLLIDADHGDVRLQSASPAVDAGIEPEAYQRFYELYGIDIRKDIEGRTRPQGSGWDIGAYEYGDSPSGYTLSVTAAHGTVTKTPNRAAYSEGESVALLATPATGYRFTGWSGALSGSANPATLVMNGSKWVGAQFTQASGGSTTSYTLTTTAVNGTVARTPNKTSYASGETVTLQATANSGYRFTGWSGSLTGTTNPASLVMNANKSVTTNVAPITDGTTGTVGNTTVFPHIPVADNRRAMQCTMPETGQLQSISMYHQGGSGRMILGVYSDNSDRPGTRLGVTSATAVNRTEGWQTISLQSPVFVPAGQTVWLAWVYENCPGIRSIEGTPGRAESNGFWSGGMPGTFGSVTTSDYLYSIYANYTPGAAPKTVGDTTVFPNIPVAANRRAMRYAMPEAGQLQSISMYHQGGSGRMFLGVYSDSSGRPGTRLGVTNATTVNRTEGWQTISLQSPVSVSAGQQIWLAWVYENCPGIRSIEGTPGRAESSGVWSGGMPGTFGSVTTSDYLYSIYANYR